MQKATAEKPAVSVIVPVYNSPPGFFDLLDSIRLQKRDTPFEIVIADDASLDETASKAERYLKSMPNARVVRLAKNLGPAAARNAGVKAARSDAFLFIDSDCLLCDETFIARFFAAHRAYPEVVIGGGIRGMGKGIVAFVDRFCHWVVAIPEKPAGPLVSGHMVTANLLIPRRAFEAVGGFDVTLRTGEDTAFCLKARELGIPLRFHGELMLVHHDRERARDFLMNLYLVGRDRAQSRISVFGKAPWFLAGPAPLRWLLVIPIALALTARNLRSWLPYDWRVLVALPGIFLGMAAMAVGVAVGRNPFIERY